MIELLDEDTEYLDQAFGSDWRLVEEGNAKFGLVIQNYPLPTGFNLSHTKLMVLIPSGYPGSHLDMFYFNPPIQTTNCRSIPALATEQHFSETWQRWSRHYEWQPGIDTVVSHLEFVRNQLIHESNR